MIIPSLIKLPNGERLQGAEEADGMLCVKNAYKGDYQEFFKGRLTPIHHDPTAGDNASEDRTTKEELVRR